jgi:pycsar effector protein
MTQEFAKDHLNLVLSFFPRVDGSIAVLVGLEVAMVGYLAPQMSDSVAWRNLEWSIVVSLSATLGSLLLSFVMLFRAGFPRLDGGSSSLIYFRAIAKRSNPEFSKEYHTADDPQLLEDLVGQIWRNSEILTLKYDRLKHAFLWLAVGIVFWLIALISL